MKSHVLLCRIDAYCIICQKRRSDRKQRIQSSGFKSISILIHACAVNDSAFFTELQIIRCSFESRICNKNLLRHIVDIRPACCTHIQSAQRTIFISEDCNSAFQQQNELEESSIESFRKILDIKDLNCISEKLPEVMNIYCVLAEIRHTLRESKRKHFIPIPIYLAHSLTSLQ